MVGVCRIFLCPEQPPDDPNNHKWRRRAPKQPATHTRKQSLRTPCSQPGCVNWPDPRQPISNGNLIEIINCRNRSTGAEIYYSVDRWQGLRLQNDARCATNMKYLLHSYSPSSFVFLSFFSSPPGWQHYKASKFQDKPLCMCIFGKVVK